MKSEYTIGKIRIPFASRARRRGFVVLTYAVVAMFLLGAASPLERMSAGAWMVAGCGMVFCGLWIVFTGIAGDMGTRGDEREMHRRDHAHYVAYRVASYCALAGLLVGLARVGPSQIALVLPANLWGRFPALPWVLLAMTMFVFVTLPRTILLWTEPDLDANPESAT